MLEFGKATYKSVKNDIGKTQSGASYIRGKNLNSLEPNSRQTTMWSARNSQT